MVVDRSGYAYITGMTDSKDFPTTEGAFDRSFNGGSVDVFVAGLSPDGSGLLFATLLGGSDRDLVYGLAVDRFGYTYVVGLTESSDFPTTEDAFDRTLDGFRDAFVTRLDPAGGELVYSSLLGGSESDGAWAIALDREGFAYVAGGTGSRDFPITEGALSATLNGSIDVFVTRLLIGPRVAPAQLPRPAPVQLPVPSGKRTALSSGPVEQAVLPTPAWVDRKGVFEKRAAAGNGPDSGREANTER
jgi:hypothetical protein